MIQQFWTRTQEPEINNYFAANEYPMRVKEELLKVIETLDYYYGLGRGMDVDGGYVALVTTQAEYDEILQKHHISRECAEFHDKLCETEKGTFYADLYIVSSDYGITIISLEKGERI